MSGQQVENASQRFTVKGIFLGLFDKRENKTDGTIISHWFLKDYCDFQVKQRHDWIWEKNPIWVEFSF